MLRQAKDHLDKSYPRILRIHDEIKTDCIRLCNEIKEIINAEDKPSFENIINIKINSVCPKLKMTYKTDLIESNTYIAPYIFKNIFKNQPIDVNDLDVIGQKLLHQKISIFAQGEESDMKKTKQVILELISNQDIRDKIKKYHHLHEELVTKPETLKKEIRDLYYSVNEGKQLDKSKDCDICQSF